MDTSACKGVTLSQIVVVTIGGDLPLNLGDGFMNERPKGDRLGAQRQSRGGFWEGDWSPANKFFLNFHRVMVAF